MVKIKINGMLPFEIREDAELLIYETVYKHNRHKGSIIRKRVADLIEKHSHESGDFLVFPILQGKYDDKIIHFERKSKNNCKVYNGKVYKDSIDLELGEDEAYILGLYTAEGSISGNRRIEFTFNAKEENLRDKVISFAKKYRYNYTVRYKHFGTTMDVIIHSVLLTDLFISLCGKGAVNKHIPQIILLHKNKKLLESYLHGYFDGDGHVDENGKLTFLTVSKLLALQIQLAGMRLNIAFRINKNRDAGLGIVMGKKSQIKESYFGSASFLKPMLIFSDDGKYVYLPIRKIERVEV